MNTARRRFLQATAGLAAGWTLDQAIRAEEAPQAKKLPIGLQLYSVRGDFARDVPGTLKAAGKLGYEGVEFYEEVFRLCETTCKTEWYIVEMGGDNGFGMDIPRKALAELRRLGK